MCIRLDTIIIIITINTKIKVTLSQ